MSKEKHSDIIAYLLQLYYILKYLKLNLFEARAGIKHHVLHKF